ncbi:MAG: PQQ-binding-like beta-propeller repeat protein [Planctomycetota bacterium]|nr:PQQ-binding-like beta-propeller repeat protein [Planctomycetota bacterium]
MPRIYFLHSLVVGCSMFCAAGVLVAGDWPQWRGPLRDGVSTDKQLLDEWPDGGPRIAWQTNLAGVGYSSLVVKDGRVITQGDLNGIEHVIAFDENDGKVLWAVQPDPVAQWLADRVANEFEQLDRNKDGRITEDEALARLGWNFNKYDRSQLKPSLSTDELVKARVDRLLKVLDKSQDGILQWSEAGALLRDYFQRIDAVAKDVDVKLMASQRGEALFTELDDNKDGKISREEARASALQRPFGAVDQRDSQTKQADGQLTLLEIKQYFEKREAGKDGKLSAAELTSYYAQHHPRGDGLLGREELRSFHGGYRNGMGDGPRGTPALDGDRVFVEGGRGDVTCLDARTGDTVWHVQLGNQLKGGVPGWGYSESPLVEGDLVIVTPGGGGGTLAALDKRTGEVQWRTGDVQEAAHYSSPVVAEICGRRQVVQFARENVFGVSLKTGELLWKYGGANNGTANCATPIVNQDHVFVSSAYGTGGGLARIADNGGTLSASQVYFEKKMANHHGGIVKVGDHMYGFGSGGLICIEFLTGKVAWRKRSVGKGSLLAADGMLFLLGENHQVALADADPTRYRERGRFKIQPHGRPSWAHPVLANGRFYIRDQESVTAYDVRDR